jgi:hypothetical protein
LTVDSIDTIPVITGPVQIQAELTKLDRLTPKSGRDPFVAQPYSESSVIITTTAKSDTAQFVFTFLLALVGDSNRFGLTHQLVSAVPT